MTTSDRVDVSEPTEDARLEAERWAEDDPTYAEIMGTYVELGELLDSGCDDSEYEVECRQLVDRVISIDRVMDTEWAERWAIWQARNMGPAHGL